MKDKKLRKGKKKTDTLERLTKFIEDHFRGVLTTALLVAVVVPLVVWLVHRAFQRSDSCSFFGVSADGFLAYAGAIFSGFMSLLVAMIALVQGKRAAEAEEERAYETRRNEVRPSLKIGVKPLGKNLFVLTIENHCDYAALDVYLFTEPFARVVCKNKIFEKQFSIGCVASNVFAVDETECGLTADGMPKMLWLCFGDIDNNVWEQEFHYTSDGCYFSSEATLV